MDLSLVKYFNLNVVFNKFMNNINKIKIINKINNINRIYRINRIIKEVCIVEWMGLEVKVVFNFKKSILEKLPIWL